MNSFRWRLSETKGNTLNRAREIVSYTMSLIRWNYSMYFRPTIMLQFTSEISKGRKCKNITIIVV